MPTPTTYAQRYYEVRFNTANKWHVRDGNGNILVQQLHTGAAAATYRQAMMIAFWDGVAAVKSGKVQ